MMHAVKVKHEKVSDYVTQRHIVGRTDNALKWFPELEMFFKHFRVVRMDLELEMVYPDGRLSQVDNGDHYGISHFHIYKEGQCFHAPIRKDGDSE